MLPKPGAATPNAGRPPAENRSMLRNLVRGPRARQRRRVRVVGYNDGMRIDTLTDDQVDAALVLWASTEHLGPVAPEELDQIRRHDADLVLGARDDDGRLLGVVIGAWDGRRGMINRLAVAPAARRRGVAQALAKEIEERLHARGCRRVSLLVFAGNGGGRDFWRKAGYREFEDVVMFSREIGTPTCDDDAADPGC